MLLALAVACRDPVLADIEAVRLPPLAAAAPVADRPVVAVTGDAVLFDPGPWRTLDPEARPRRVLSLSDAQGHEYALPALVEALAPLADLAIDRDDEVVVAVVAGGDAPYRAVVRVLYSLGMAQVEDAELRVTTPSGPGAVPLAFPRVCGADGPTCVLASVTEAAEGLQLVLDEVPDGGCHGGLAGTAIGDGWRGHVALAAPGACPSVPGRDPAALRALLARAAPLGPPCDVATLAPLDASPWGDVVALVATLRERSPATMLGISLSTPPACDQGVPLP